MADEPFEVEELFGAEDVPRELATSYSVRTLAQRWLQPNGDSFATKIWAAGHLRDLRYASLAEPSNAAMAALVFKAALVVLAARMGERARVMHEARDTHLRLAPAVDPVARLILMPPDPDGQLSQYLDNRVSGMKAMLVDYAASGEVTWLSLMPEALEESARPPFLEAPELVHAELIALDGLSPSLSDTVDNFAAHVRGLPQTGGRISVRAATDAVLRRFSDLLDSDPYLKARDIFDFERLGAALARRDVRDFFQQLSDLMANRAGSEFDERGHPVTDADAPVVVVSYPREAPFLARALQAWNASGELQRKLLDGKHLPAEGAAAEARARLAFIQPRSPYGDLRLGEDYDPTPLIDAAVARMQPDNLLTRAAQADDAGEFVYTLRQEDSEEVIEQGGGGIVALQLLQPGGSEPLHERVVQRLGGAAAMPSGIVRFVPPDEAFEATPVPFNPATFMIERVDPPRTQRKKQYVRGVKIRSALMHALLYDPTEIYQWLTDETSPPRTLMHLPGAAAFEGRGGWTVHTTATDQCRLAVAGETAPVVVGNESVGYVRVVDAVRLDSRPARQPSSLPHVHTRGLVGSTWFAPLDTPRKVSERRDLFANGEALLRAYLAVAERLLRTNVIWFIEALKDREALKKLAMQMFGTHEVTQGRQKNGEQRPTLKHLGRRAGPADEAAMFYAQIGLGRFFQASDAPAPVLQLVALTPLLFRIVEDAGAMRLIVFPNVVPSTSAELPPADGWASALARQWRSGGAATVYWTRASTDAELFIRLSRSDAKRAPTTKLEDEDQYGQWLTVDELGAINLAAHRVAAVVDAPPPFLIYNDRHYVWISERQIYAAQEQTYDYYEVALLYADAALQLATRSFANLEPLRSPGSPSWTRPNVRMPPRTPVPIAPLPPAPEELLSFAGTEPLPFGSAPPGQLDALYSYTVASAVLRHADAALEVRQRFYRIVERIGEFIERGSVATFFRDACYSSTNRPLVSAIAEFDVLFEPELFGWDDAALPDGFVKQAIVDPLRDLEAVHLANDPVHQSVASSLLRLASKPRIDLLEELQGLQPNQAGDYCSNYGLHWVCEDMVRTLIQDGRSNAATFMSAAFVRDWFFRPRLYDAIGMAHTKEVAWLGFDQATALDLRIVPDGWIVSGLCALYSLAEARRAATATLPF